MVSLVTIAGLWCNLPSRSLNVLGSRFEPHIELSETLTKKTAPKSHSLCTDWMSVPPTFIGWNLTHDGTIFGGGTFVRRLGDEGRASWVGLVSWKRPQRAPLPFPPREDTAKSRGPSVNQERGSRQSPNLWALRYGTSQPPALWEIHFCCLSATESTVFLLQQPKWIKMSPLHPALMSRTHGWCTENSTFYPKHP